MPETVVLCGAFDDLRSRGLRLLQQAAKLGRVRVLVWPDQSIRSLAGAEPKFPLPERLYFLRALRFVDEAVPLEGPIAPDELPARESSGQSRAAMWVDEAQEANNRRRDFCQKHGLEYRIFSAEQLQGFPEPAPYPAPSDRERVVVTGCYDWLHSGHVRFFEEVSSYGQLYVIVGHDANIRLLKGAGHPLLSQEERRYMVSSIRYVTGALISSGDGWLDADPEIRRLRPAIYAVNEDGDRGGKREYCEKMGLRYLVLKRVPAAGLPQRSSTTLRGF
jgi:cytidyltransferase-like protein